MLIIDGISTPSVSSDDPDMVKSVSADELFAQLSGDPY
jgi:hypothetical protein